LVDSDEAVEEAIEQAEDVEALQRDLAEGREKADSYLANWQRCQADLANYKRRAELDRAEVVDFANSALICSILPVMDDFERALASVPDESEGSSWTEGIRLIWNKLKAILEAQGLTCIEARGEPFDPRLHEAIMQHEGKEGLVVEETQKGYKFRDRVVRPSLVVVGHGETKGKARQTNCKEKQSWEEQ